MTQTLLLLDVIKIVAPAIIVCITGFIAWLRWKLAQTTEQKQKIELQLREIKQEKYEKAVNFLYSILQNADKPYNAKKKSRQQIKEIAETYRSLTLFAPDSVITAYDNFMKSAQDYESSEENTIKLVIKLGQVIIEIRKDMGNPDTEYSAEDVARQLLNDFDEKSKELGLDSKKYYF